MALYLLAGIVGAAVGSFLNVCVGRWPAGESVVKPRSRCPRCGHQITWYENIPVLSWLALRARCSGCGLPISAQYPLVELATAGIWMLALWLLGPSVGALRLAVFATLLLGVVLTDLQHYEIPDGFTVTGLVAALVGAFAALLLREPDAPFASLPDAILGACVGAGMLSIVRWLGEKWLQQEAMGFGDVTLMAMIGAHLGPWRSLLTVFVGAAIGLVVVLALSPFLPRVPASPEPAVEGTGSTDGPAAPVHAEGEQGDLPIAGAWGFPPIPFGVFLAPGALVALLYGDRFITWYLSNFPTP